MIQLADAIVPAAHQGQNFAGVRIHDNHRDLGLRSGQDFGLVLVLADLCPLGAQLGDLVVDQLDSGLHGCRRCLLQVGIDRGVNSVALIVHLALVEFADQSVAQQVNEVGRVAGLDVGRRQFQAVWLWLFPHPPG